MDSLPLILLAIGGIVLTFGDILMKKWVVSDSHIFYVVGMILYIVGLMFLVQTYKYKHIAIASAIFVLFNIIVLSLVSYFYFKEGLSNIQIFGIVLTLISIVILELGESI